MLSRIEALSSTSAWLDSRTVVFIDVSLKSSVLVFIDEFIIELSFFCKPYLSEKSKSVPFLVFWMSLAVSVKY